MANIHCLVDGRILQKRVSYTDISNSALS